MEIAVADHVPNGRRMLQELVEEQGTGHYLQATAVTSSRAREVIAAEIAQVKYASSGRVSMAL